MTWPPSLRVVTWNFETLGWDETSGGYGRLHYLTKVLGAIPDADIVFLQEAWKGDFDGSRLIFDVEDMLRPFADKRGMMRAFYFPPRRGDSVMGEVILVRWPLIRPRRQYVHGAPDVFHDQAGILHVEVDQMDEPLRLHSFQWPYWSGDQRLDRALKLTGHAAGLTLFGGDANSQWPGKAEFEPDWRRRPPHKRHHKSLPPGMRPAGRQWVSDRRALQVLDEAGFVNLGTAASDETVTVNTHIDDGQGARIDHLIASPALAPALVPGSYTVHISTECDAAGDHRPVSARLDLARLIPWSQV